MKSEHPLWNAGFRPFFTCAFIFGSLAPWIWYFLFFGSFQLPPGGLSNLQWHAHEMFFGFGWAVLGGFLLTASKNWVSVRGIHGKLLMTMTCFWLLERMAIIYLGQLPSWLAWISCYLFLISITTYICWTLLYYRKQDNYSDNFIFLFVLPLFFISKSLLLSANYFQFGVGMTLGIFRVAFVVMFERTLTQFMKNAMKIQLPRIFFLDFGVKLLAVILIFEKLLPTVISSVLLFVFGSLLFVRFLMWKPFLAFTNFGISLSYLGYLGLVMHLFFQSMILSGILPASGSLAMHIFTFLCMGVVVAAMMLRISQGHTGRKFQFTRIDRMGFIALFFAAFFRLVATQIWPLHFQKWIFCAALGWSFCFAILGFRLIPFLFQSRTDGRNH